MGFASLLRAKIIRATYRVRDGQRRIDCPHPDYRDVFVVLPKEWLGVHAIRKDRARTLAAKHGSGDIIDFCVCMAVLEDWQNIPGIEGKDPEKWNLERVPVPVMAWVVQEVLSDFSAAYAVPKVS